MGNSNNVQAAMDWLADTADGALALKAVSDAGEALRSKLPIQLSNSELQYVMQRLWVQRAPEGWDQNAHFDVQPTAAGAAGVAPANLPANLSVVNRVRDFGFVIRASIPQSRFGT
ncbi:Uncharacterised protein [Burkholderia pseudomallei]|nr:Uncharacterised protein [Burkholderia pseudomallei]VBY63045.1 Uncharacterised protein [Burkholderia pseudomallei]VBY77234.1 Uncharacterised protein [Burkholderia pseudomallei]VBY88208.1 Uncharacterised protein [Burkholderia pseudomallei]